jgi:hypothetical protein
VRDYYLGRMPEAGFEVVFDPYGGEPGRFEAMALLCRPGGRPPRVVFAGLARAYGPPEIAGDLALTEQSVTAARIEWAGMQISVRASRRDPPNLWETVGAYGARDAHEIWLHGHPALLAGGETPEGRLGLVTWYCPVTGHHYVCAFGPFGSAPAESDVGRLGLECLHP